MPIIITIFISLSALVGGFFIGWIIAIKTGLKKFDSADENMRNAFKAITAEQLDKNSDKLAKMAGERDEILKLQLGHHKEAITNLLDPLSKKIELIDKERIETFAKLKSELQHVSKSNEKLRGETGNLVNALRRPEVRGRWGEVTLRRVVEIAGMTVHIDFDEQQSVTLESGRKRPDMVIHLPQNREVVVDSKVSLDAYLSAYEEVDGTKREELLKRHAKAMKNHVTELSQKNYWEEFSEGIEFVVMFVPNDAFLEAAFQYDANLMDYAMQKNIIIATPATLMAILQTIEFGWRQTVIQDNAREVSELGKELYARVNTFIGHIESIRSNINNLIKNFNKTVGSIERKLLPQMRRFDELGAGDGKKLNEPEKIDDLPRTVSGELPQHTQGASRNQ
ncbi:DNA recombination protein RmuC [bacterium]|nr:DNA recombination protein RmuC [bacterium]